MSFSVFLFAADPQRLRETLASDSELVSEVAAHAERHGADADEIRELRARAIEVQSLSWPAGADMLSVNAFMWMLDYAAEPINISRLQDVRYSSDVDVVPLLPEMTADPGPLPLPEVRGLDCEIGYLAPDKLRELAALGAPPCGKPAPRRWRRIDRGLPVPGRRQPWTLHHHRRGRAWPSCATWSEWPSERGNGISG